MRRLLVALSAAHAIAWPCFSAAQPAILSDGKMPTPTVVPPSGDGLNYTVSGGYQQGTNLFHSFSRFNVPSGGSATFDGPASIQNILSRVTSTESSFIDGTVSTRAAMPTANFYLINPNGIVFGANAFLDVGGSFHASTANYIKLADGNIFSATPSDSELLTSAAPQAFGFLTSNPAPISVEGAFLQVDQGQTISLVGGEINIKSGVALDGTVFGAFIAAPGGLVRIASAASNGEATLSAPDLGMNAFARLGPVSIFEGSVLTGSSGGSVIIRGGQIVVDNSIINTDNIDVALMAVGVDLGATGSIVIRNGSLVQTIANGANDGTSIAINAGSLTIRDGAIVETVAPQDGRGGPIDIHVGALDILNGAINTVSNHTAPGNITIVASGTVNVAGGSAQVSTSADTVIAGNLSITAADLQLNDQAKIISGGFTGVQAGQNLSVTASGTLTISGGASISSNAELISSGSVDVSASRLV